jgi:hypothetical protein
MSWLQEGVKTMKTTEVIAHLGHVPSVVKKQFAVLEMLLLITLL